MKLFITMMLLSSLSYANQSQPNSVYVGFNNAVNHSGGTDSSGCHRDRKRGGRHCH